MARVRLNPYLQRSVETKKLYLGKTILFCEGKTEYNYFDYFADIIKASGDKYSHIELKLITADGNAQTVMNHANDFLGNEDNSLKYINYDNYVKHKSSPGMIRQIIGNCDSVRNAIKNAKELEKTYGDRNYNYEECIDSMNPYTTVHQLVEKLIE
ncbi:RloB family protein [Clostridium sp. CS001]|uniref:RloB family protein n=1 Tax=Clostridium sp. CS001 TaxID=2880648 RepID=UPI001CF50F44|nr:RloB family protein [Clostridium sp. CS001]MCB2289525.1 RloB family protein [Clostridium sp. CS001]